MDLDIALAYLGRRICRIRGGRRLVSPLRRYYSGVYHDRPDRWAVIHDYRGRLQFKVDRAAYIGSAIYWQGWHHLEELNYIERELHEGDVFVDAGANTGEFTVAVAGHRGRVLAFEPQPDVHAILADNVRINGLTGVRLLREGLSDGEGEAVLYTSGDRTRFAGVNEGMYTQFPDEWSNVPAGTMRYRALDTVLKDERVSRVDWLKVDVEGGELPLLRGASGTLERSKPRLIVEFNESAFRAAGYTGVELDRFLRGFGYVPFRFTRSGPRRVEIESIGHRTRNLLFTAGPPM